MRGMKDVSVLQRSNREVIKTRKYFTSFSSSSLNQGWQAADHLQQAIWPNGFNERCKTEESLPENKETFGFSKCICSDHIIVQIDIFDKQIS